MQLGDSVKDRFFFLFASLSVSAAVHLRLDMRKKEVLFLSLCNSRIRDLHPKSKKKNNCGHYTSIYGHLYGFITRVYIFIHEAL